MSNFGERLKILRKAENLRAEDLAAWLGVKRRIIFCYEKNEAKPSFEILIALADFFCVSVDYLVGRCDDSRREEFLSRAEDEILQTSSTLRLATLMWSDNKISESERLDMVRKFRLIAKDDNAKDDETK